MKRLSCAKYNKQKVMQKWSSRNFGGTYSSCNSAIFAGCDFVFQWIYLNFTLLSSCFKGNFTKTSSNMFEEICFLVMLCKFVVNLFNAMINAMYILPGCFSKLWRLEQQLLDVWLIPGHHGVMGVMHQMRCISLCRINSLERFEFSQPQLLWQKSYSPSQNLNPIHFTIHSLSISPPEKWILRIWMIPGVPDFGAPFWGDTSLFRKSQVMNKKVRIREAFHFEDEKKQVPSWNARNRTSSNWKRVIEVAELPNFSFWNCLQTPKAFSKKSTCPLRNARKAVVGVSRAYGVYFTKLFTSAHACVFSQDGPRA